MAEITQWWGMSTTYVQVGAVMKPWMDEFAASCQPSAVLTLLYCMVSSRVRVWCHGELEG